MRCSMSKKDELKSKMGCSAWGNSYSSHLWGIFKGKTIIVKMKRGLESLSHAGSRMH